MACLRGLAELLRRIRGSREPEPTVTALTMSMLLSDGGRREDLSAGRARRGA